MVAPSLAGFLSVLALLAWMLQWRWLGASLVSLSLGAVLLPTLVAPIAGADRVARQLRFPKQDPRRLTDIPPRDVATGLLLVTLWQLRWLILAGLILTPALMIGIFRMDVAEFTVWSGSADALAGATAASRAEWLLPDGEIPVFRLFIRALSAGLLPWVTLPLFSALGVALALLLRDSSLSALVSLLTELVLAGAIVLFWVFLVRTTFLAGWLEVVRIALLVALVGGLMWATAVLNIQSGRLLLVPPDQPVVIGRYTIGKSNDESDHPRT